MIEHPHIKNLDKFFRGDSQLKFTGIDIGGTKCAVISGSIETGIQDKIKFDTTNVDETIANIIKAAEKLGTCDAIGISCGGPIDSKNGIIMSPPNLPGWDNIEIVRILAEKFNVPVGLQNDANACALAEWRFGAGRGTENMVFLTFGTGMGAGLILNGKLYSVTNDMAGEVGHIRMADYGPVGYGKTGSFEGFCSGGGIAKLGKILAEEKLQRGEVVSYCKSCDELENITAKSIAECAKLGAVDAMRVYDICAEKLGEGLSILIDILNTEKIVIGSVFERSEELLRDKMEKIVNSEALNYARKVCEIVPAQLGDSIGDWAAIAIAENVLRS